GKGLFEIGRRLAVVLDQKNLHVKTSPTLTRWLRQRKWESAAARRWTRNAGEPPGVVKEPACLPVQPRFTGSAMKRLLPSRRTWTNTAVRPAFCACSTILPMSSALFTGSEFSDTMT